MNELEQEYIKAGCHIVNALVTAAGISTEDGPTVNITLKLPCGGVVFGGICFGTYDAACCHGHRGNIGKDA